MEDTMDHEQARQKLLDGGYFIALEVPTGVEFGIDLKSYQTGPQFRGVKMIPSGLHLAHYGTGEGEKQGFFFRSAAGSVAATHWDASSEDLVNSEACLSEGSLRSLRDSVLRLEMEANLGPYPFDQRTAWLNLTNCISESVLNRCGISLGDKVLAGCSDVEAEAEGRRGGGSGMEVVPHFPHVGRVARYCKVPGRVTAACLKNAGQGAGGEQVDPQEITRRNMDQSQALRDMISGNFGGNWLELLGEMQLSFVLFVSLCSLRGFRHWQAVCALLCQCGVALGTHPALFVAFIRILHAQLKLVPEDFFEAEISKDNFLVASLSALVQNILPSDNCPLSPSLVDAAERLVKFLRQRFDLFDTGAGESTASSVTNRIGFDEDAVPWGDDESSDEETRVSTSVEASAVERVEDRLGLMRRLELSEEDRPAVVPYEEVTRVLGAGAFVEEGVPEQLGVRQQPAGSNQVDESSPAQSSEDALEKTLLTAATGGAKLKKGMVESEAKPSEEHAQRWRDIDRLLSTSKQRSAAPSSSTSHKLASRRPRASNPRAGTGNGDLAAMAVAAGGRLAAAARRYPLLFASTSPKEDIIMAAARLLCEQGESNAAAKAQAVGFLQELEGSEDQGAAFLRLSVVAPSPLGLGDD